LTGLLKHSLEKVEEETSHPAPAELPVGVGKSEPGCCTLCAAPGPTLEIKRRIAVSTHEAAGEGRIYECLLSSPLHAQLCVPLLWHPDM
ncbi:hypothetical protein T10_1140, partial [Trichinella papuae]